ncbi:lipoprotein [Ferrimonas marina]|uniref:Uncharacterized protein n=1 Tax=Ferrimonas marina TaxID=299255 RepID=A0A1M5Z911_9GAMM|nr:lipoprotein [Ferrimonas marina]SHI20736.1 hypothetical protein SAMN02745129_0030 [Ferrimonas marina]
MKRVNLLLLLAALGLTACNDSQEGSEGAAPTPPIELPPSTGRDLNWDNESWDEADWQ